MTAAKNKIPLASEHKAAAQRIAHDTAFWQVAWDVEMDRHHAEMARIHTALIAAHRAQDALAASLAQQYNLPTGKYNLLPDEGVFVIEQSEEPLAPNPEESST